MFENIVEQIEAIPGKIVGRVTAEMENIMHATKQEVIDAIGEMKADFTKQIEDVKADFTKQIADLKAAPAALVAAVSAADAEAEGSDLDDILGAVKGSTSAPAAASSASTAAPAASAAGTASGDVTVPAGEGATGTGFDSILQASTADTVPASVASQMPESNLAAHGGITDENPNITAETGNATAPKPAS